MMNNDKINNYKAQQKKDCQSYIRCLGASEFKFKNISYD